MKKILYLLVAFAIGIIIFQFGVEYGKSKINATTVMNQTVKVDEVEAISLETEDIYQNTEVNLINIVSIGMFLLVALLGCILLAKRNHLLFLHEVKETKQQPTFSQQGVRQQYE